MADVKPDEKARGAAGIAILNRIEAAGGKYVPARELADVAVDAYLTAEAEALPEEVRSVVAELHDAAMASAIGETMLKDNEEEGVLHNIEPSKTLEGRALLLIERLARVQGKESGNGQ